MEDPTSSKLAVISSKIVWHVVNTVQGAVLGDAEGLDGVAGDIVASFVLYGDLRDLALLGPRIAFGQAEPGDKLVMSFACLGVVTTLYPPADPFVGLAKVVAKRVAGTRLLVAVEKVSEKIFAAESFEALVKIGAKYGKIFKKIATDDLYVTRLERIFKDRIAKHEGDATQEALAWFDEIAEFELRYGDDANDILSNLERRYASSADVNIDSVLRATVEATAKVTQKLEKLGITLSPDAVEGIGILMRNTSKDSAGKYIGNPDNAMNVVGFFLYHQDTKALSDAIKGECVEKFFRNLKRATDSDLPGVDTLIRKSSNFWGQIQGTFHHLEAVLDDLGVSTLKRVEDGLTNPGRIYDAVGKDGKLYEFKNFTHYFGKNRDTIIQQFMKDVDKLDERLFVEGKVKWYFRGPRDAKKGAEDIVKEMQKILDNRFKGKYSIETIIEFQGKRVPY